MSPRNSGVRAALPWRPVLVFTSVGLALLLLAATWPATSVGEAALMLSLAALAGGTAYVLDEAAAEAVGATPLSLRRRTRARLVVVGLPWLVGTAGLGAVAVRGGTAVTLGVVVQLTGCLLLAFGASSVARRTRAEPGELIAGTLAAAIVALGVVNPFAQWVDLFPTREGQRWGSSIVVWSGIALVCIALGVRATRDPLD